MRALRQQLTTRSLDMLKEIQERPTADGGNSFWTAFGRNIKLGCVVDASNRDALAALLRFHSSKSGAGLIGLRDYVTRCAFRVSHLALVMGPVPERKHTCWVKTISLR